MAFLAKLCLSLFSLVGVSSAVGVPLALKTNERSAKRDDEGGAGGADAKNMISLAACGHDNKNNLKEVNYGYSGGREICWTFVSEENREGSLSFGNEYTSLFQETWDKSGESWKGPTFGRWSQQCIDNHWPTKWAVLLSSDNGSQHLGYCGESLLSQTKFVKKTKKDLLSAGDKDNWSLWICGADCWETDSGSILGTPEVLQREKGDNWKKIKFYER